MSVKVGKLYYLRDVNRLAIVEKLSDRLWRPKEIVRLDDLPGISLRNVDSIVLAIDIAKLSSQLATDWQEITGQGCHRTRIPIVLWNTWCLAVDFGYLFPVKNTAQL